MMVRLALVLFAPACLFAQRDDREVSRCGKLSRAFKSRFFVGILGRYCHQRCFVPGLYSSRWDTQFRRPEWQL